jgi:ADP-heptose:LPS heptosyltransferase
MDDPRLVPDVEKIAVLRPNGIGDFVFSLPALHALKAAYPQAKLIYIGKQWHADFLHGRPGPIDEVAVMPPYPGVEAPPDADPAPAQSFIDALRAARFDLAVQIYGGGRYSNPLVKRFEARITIGIKAADAEPLDRWVSFSRLHNNRLLMLEVAALAGANRLRLGRELEVTDRDRQEAASVIPADQFRPLVLIHPGAGDPRRHWPAERFAAVADALFEAGALIAMNGTAIEGPEVRRVIDAMRHPALDLSDRLSIAGLCGVLERCALVVSNDSGPLHLALAVGAPAVGIYWLTNLYDGGPLVQDRHRAAMSSRTHCPVCGAENLKSRCPHDVSFVDDVTVDEVLAMSMELLHDSRRRWPDVPSGE